MFNNANVLYKTKFVDGVSTVTRYVQHSKSGSVSSNVADKENSHTAKKKQQTAKRARVE
jgi:structural maintenance of chromosome 2